MKEETFTNTKTSCWSVICWHKPILLTSYKTKTLKYLPGEDKLADPYYLSIQYNRLSKSGRHTDTRLRKFFHNLRKILDFDRKTVKITSFNLVLLTFNALFLCFMAFPAHFHAKFILAGHFACTMKIHFKKSAAQLIFVINVINLKYIYKYM